MDNVVISIIIAIIGCLVGVAGWFGNRDKQVSAAASQMTEVLTKLEHIGANLVELKAEFKTEINGSKSEIRELRDRTTVVEQSLKTMWIRIDEFKGGESNAK